MDLPNGGETARLIARVERGLGRERSPLEDFVAREEPLELRLGKLSLGVLMRTPGHDHDLGVGFAVTEGLLHPSDPLPLVTHCEVRPSDASSEQISDDDHDAESNVLLLTPRSTPRVAAEELLRRSYTSSSCGTCGKTSLASALRAAPPLQHALRLTESWVLTLTSELRRAQPGFARTGGLHAAGLARPGERVVFVREDVGRHNAVDKCVGAALRSGACLPEFALVLSGRISFEMVQKALFAGLSAIVAVGAPTTLAVELARASGITLIGFAREARFCVYSGEETLHG